MDKSRSILGTNLSNISNINKNTTDIYIVKENKDFFYLSLHGYDLAGITPDIICIPFKNKRKKLHILWSL